MPSPGIRMEGKWGGCLGLLYAWRVLEFLSNLLHMACNTQVDQWTLEKPSISNFNRVNGVQTFLLFFFVLHDVYVDHYMNFLACFSYFSYFNWMFVVGQVGSAGLRSLAYNMVVNAGSACLMSSRYVGLGCWFLLQTCYCNDGGTFIFLPKGTWERLL